MKPPIKNASLVDAFPFQTFLFVLFNFCCSFQSSHGAFILKCISSWWHPDYKELRQGVAWSTSITQSLEPESTHQVGSTWKGLLIFCPKRDMFMLTGWENHGNPSTIYSFQFSGFFHGCSNYILGADLTKLLPEGISLEEPLLHISIEFLGVLVCFWTGLVF